MIDAFRGTSSESGGVKRVHVKIVRDRVRLSHHHLCDPFYFRRFARFELKSIEKRNREFEATIGKLQSAVLTVHSITRYGSDRVAHVLLSFFIISRSRLESYEFFVRKGEIIRKPGLL